jgi:hypothetical protein
LKETDALDLFKTEHTSRDQLHHVVFKLNFDLDKGHNDYHDKDEKYWGSLSVCFDLPKLMENDDEYDDKVLISRYSGKIHGYYKE